MSEISAAEASKIRLKKSSLNKQWIDPKGHILTFQGGGTFEAVILYCETCNLAYKFTKTELEKLDDVK